MAITAVLTPFDNFSGHSKIHYGVGEQVKLDVKEAPPANPPTPLAWVVKSGPASVHNDPKVPGRGTLACGNIEGAVVLELRNTKDKSLVDSKRFQVVAPAGFDTKIIKKLNSPTEGYGFVVGRWLKPHDVSFKWVDTRELSAPHEGTGCFKKSYMTPNGAGKFKNEGAWIHPVEQNWVQCSGGKSKNQNGIDTVTMVWPDSWAPGGTFEWRIPQYYRVRGVAKEFKFAEYIHKAVINAAGVLQLTKFGQEIKLRLPASK